MLSSCGTSDQLPYLRLSLTCKVANDSINHRQGTAHTRGSRNGPKRDGMSLIIPKGIEKTDIGKYCGDKIAPRRYLFAQRRERFSSFPSSGLLWIRISTCLSGTQAILPCWTQTGLGSNPLWEKMNKWIHFLRPSSSFHFFVIYFIQYDIECFLCMWNLPSGRTCTKPLFPHL